MDYLGRPYYTLAGAGGGGGGGGTGDVVGPSSSTVNAFARFAGTDGKTIKNSNVTMTDNGQVIGLLSIDPKYIISTDFLLLEGAASVETLCAGSSLRVDGNVVLDTDGVVSLTGRASPQGISLAGNTVLSGNLDLTGGLNMTGDQIKGVGTPTLFDDVATKEYVDTQFKGWGQMLYNSPTGAELFTSTTLNTSTFGRLFPPIIGPIPVGYFISTSGQVDVLNNVDFVLQRPGNYRLRYRVGLLATTPLQVMILVLRINNIDVAESEQYMQVDNVSVKYHDFEFIFTSSVTFNNVSIFAKVSTPTPIKTSYLCFNVTSL